MSRPSFDTVWMGVAGLIAMRATCDRAHVGVVITLNDRVVSTGYNGSPPGEAHCDDEGHLMEDGHCVRTIHAEDNAIRHRGERHLHGATCYTTHSPCVDCAKLLIEHKIARVVVGRPYGSTYQEARENMLAAGILVEEWDGPR